MNSLKLEVEDEPFEVVGEAPIDCGWSPWLLTGFPIGVRSVGESGLIENIERVLEPGCSGYQHYSEVVMKSTIAYVYCKEIVARYCHRTLGEEQICSNWCWNRLPETVATYASCWNTLRERLYEVTDNWTCDIFLERTMTYYCIVT